MYLEKREDIIILDDGSVHRDPKSFGWWYSPAAYVVKWTVILSLFLGFFLWITLGYIHARRRMRAGLKPLAYHRVRVFEQLMNGSLRLMKVLVADSKITTQPRHTSATVL